MSSRLNVELHPMQNVEILSTIFSFSSVNDLKNCRLAGSKLWLKASVTSWREKTVLKIRPEPDKYPGKVTGICLHELQKIYEDESDPYKIHRKPFKNFKLEGFDHLNLENCQLTWVLDNFSEHIQHIAFKMCSFATLKALLVTIFRRLPDLRELKLENHIFVKSFGNLGDGVEFENITVYPRHQNLKSITVEAKLCEVTAFSQWFRLILKNIADLQHFRIQPNKYWWKAGDGQAAMTSVAFVRKEVGPSLLSIRNLDIPSVPLTDTGFTGPDNFHLEASFPLRRFTGSMSNALYLKPFVQSLEYLKAIFKEDKKASKKKKKSTSDIDQISLPLVKEFHAHGTPLMVFQNLNKVNVPNLETLVVDESYLARENPKGCQVADIDFQNPSFRNVTRLECYQSLGCYIIDSEDFELLSGSMPNVNHAKMPLTRMAFRKLCGAWPNLLTLTISQTMARHKLIDDEAITGIKPNAEGDGDRPANITNLKKLTDFASYNGHLTDHSVNFGFLLLPRLHYLKVNVKKISTEAHLALRNKVSFVQVLRF